MKKVNNITLIGMAGVGKTTIGKELAEFLNYKLIDTDDLTEQKNNATFQEMIDKFGENFCLQKEEEAILNIGNISKSIVVTGGSCVYSEKAMDFLKKISLAIFLHSSYESIEKRIPNLDTRGIIGLKTKTLKELYNERLPLYQKYADETIFIPDNFEVDNVLKEIKSIADNYLTETGQRGSRK